MQAFASHLVSIVFAAPLVGMLLSSFFHVEERMGSPVKPVARRRQVSGVDRRGIPLCLDPDGTSPDGSEPAIAWSRPGRERIRVRTRR